MLVEYIEVFGFITNLHVNRETKNLAFGAGFFGFK